MVVLVLSVATLIVSLLPFLLYLVNLPLFAIDRFRLFHRSQTRHEKYSVSVLIPARDEANSIDACLQNVLCSQGVELQVIVLDDQSRDATAAIVLECAKRDTRIELATGSDVPSGWNGKQHACWRLAQRAQHPWLVFLDADVRIAPDSIHRLIDYADRNHVALLSAFPGQQTGTLLEKMLIPVMHIVLLCYLPLLRMRTCTHTSYAAGCGQLFVTNQDEYRQMGTHQAIRESRHDGIKLPRAYRLAGLSTDVVDGTSLATCRMYRSAGEVVRGLLKNADEGIANAKLILPFSFLLLGSTVVPLILAAVLRGVPLSEPYGRYSLWVATTAIVVGWIPRWVNVWWFKQSLIGAALHPFSVLLFVVLQWIALGMGWCGQRVPWRGRE